MATRSPDAGVGVDASVVATAGRLEIEVTTQPTEVARYAPQHVVAIWVEDGRGQPVRVLAVWGALRLESLLRFNDRVSPMWQEEPDVVTGATLLEYGPQRVQWDLTAASGARVPDGTYGIWVEIADSRHSKNGPDPTLLTHVPFSKGPEPLELTTEATRTRCAVRLTYKPDAPVAR